MLLPIALLLQVAAAAAAAPAQTPPPLPDDVVVEARRLDRHRRDDAAVRALARPTAQGGNIAQFARWHQPLCIATIGFAPAQGRFIVDRIAALARTVGLSDPREKCATNVAIFLSADPATFIAAVRTHAPKVFDNATIFERDIFERSDAPIRWIAGTRVISAQADTVDISNGDGVLPVWQASRIKTPTQTLLARLVIVVDERRLHDMPLGSLADYLGFVTLARPRDGADVTGVPSILSLFSGRTDAQKHMTRFDRAYLQAYYKAAPALSDNAQRSEIAAGLDRALSLPDRPDDPQ